MSSLNVSNYLYLQSATFHTYNFEFTFIFNKNVEYQQLHLFQNDMIRFEHLHWSSMRMLNINSHIYPGTIQFALGGDLPNPLAGHTHTSLNIYIYIQWERWLWTVTFIPEWLNLIWPDGPTESTLGASRYTHTSLNIYIDIQCEHLIWIMTFIL